MPSRRTLRLVGLPAVSGGKTCGLASAFVAAGLLLLSSSPAAAVSEDVGFPARVRKPAPKIVPPSSLKNIRPAVKWVDPFADPPDAASEAPTPKITPKIDTKSDTKSDTKIDTKIGPAVGAAKGGAKPGAVPSVQPPPLAVEPPPVAAPTPPPPPVKMAPPPPDQSWLQDVAEKAGVRSRGKAAVFVIKGDEYYQPVRGAVVKTLRRRGLNVTTNLRPVDSATQYREMSQTLQLGVFIDGELRGEGARQTAKIRLRSGLSGQPLATATFTGPTKKIVGDLNQKFWTRFGPAISRSCTSATRQRRLERAPMRIEAGSPDDSTLSMRGN